MEYINTPKEIIVSDLVNTKDLYFIYESDIELDVLRPQTYENLISKIGSHNVKKLVKHDAKFRSSLTNHHNRTSFLHCSISGFSTYYNYENLFDSNYYTYYFKLTLQEIEKCAFSIKNEKGEIENIGGGVAGIIAVLKKWGVNKDNNVPHKDENGNILVYPEVNAIIPFKIKPLYCLKPCHLRKYYHGTTKKLSEIKSGSFVTPYIEDAKSFAVPWSSDDLIYTEHETSEVEGRPPQNILFKTGVKIPRDRKIYIYELENARTISSKTNTGKEYPWNRTLVKSCNVNNVIVINSWKKEFNKK